MLKLPQTILVVDDDEAVLETVRCLLDDEGFQVEAATTGWEALDLVGGHEFDLAVVDIRLGGEFDGLDLVQYIRTRQPKLRVLFISGLHFPVADDPDRDDFVSKPFLLSELLGCVWELLQRRVPDIGFGSSHIHAKRAIIAAKIDLLRNRHKYPADAECPDETAAEEPGGARSAGTRHASGLAN
ncbi:MAG TPA: response regulator [Stellaceae bacterium]|jgi:DNA-binding response OmpR family regulator